MRCVIAGSKQLKLRIVEPILDVLYTSICPKVTEGNFFTTNSASFRRGLPRGSPDVMKRKTMQIYAKSPNLNPKQPFYKWWAIKSMISNLYIGNGCFTMSIQFKNRLFGFPGTFLGEIHPCFTAPCLWQEGLPWSFTFRFEAFTTYESVPSREITPHHLQMLQKKYSVGVMYIPETL